MQQCKQFKHLLNAIKKYSKDVTLPSNCFATGTIFGYKFRLFQELDVYDMKGEGHKYRAWLGIFDETSSNTKVPAFYNKSEIDEWVDKHLHELDILDAGNLKLGAKIMDRDKNIGTVTSIEDMHNIEVEFENDGYGFWCFAKCQDCKEYSKDVKDILFLIN
jgi:hypothetical protein